MEQKFEASIREDEKKEKKLITEKNEKEIKTPRLIE